jgi:hypothetical protein
MVQQLNGLRRIIMPSPRDQYYDHPAFNTWRYIKQVCYNPNNHNYPHIGALGIELDASISDKLDFLAYCDEHLGPKPEGYVINRLDWTKNYEPGNLEWAPRKRAYNNSRHNCVLTHNGKTQTVKQWAEELGMYAAAIHNRLKAGFTVEQALDVDHYYYGKRLGHDPVDKNQYKR